MKIVCAWCQKPVGEKPPYENTGVTHTICPECGAKYFPEIPQTFGDFVEKLKEL